jgi:hypothetical protein
MKFLFAPLTVLAAVTAVLGQLTINTPCVYSFVLTGRYSSPPPF